MSLLTNWLESLSYDLEISEACIRKISPLSSCAICLQACPIEAIDIDKNTITINEKTCSSCGICITVCPSHAIKGQSPSRNVVQDYLLIEETSAMPTVNELHYFYKKGIRFVYSHEASPSLEQVISKTNADLDAMGLDRVQMADKLALQPEEQPKLTRRDFFTKLSSASKKTVLSSVTPAKWRFNEESFKLSSLYKDFSFHVIDLDEETCTLCEACITICPVKAFEIKDGSLIIQEQRCTGCQLCSDICRSNSLKIERNVHPSAVIQKPVHESTCTACKTQFHAWTDTTICPICSSRQQNGFFI